MAQLARLSPFPEIHPDYYRIRLATGLPSDEPSPGTAAPRRAETVEHAAADTPAEDDAEASEDIGDAMPEALPRPVITKTRLSRAKRTKRVCGRYGPGAQKTSRRKRTRRIAVAEQHERFASMAPSSEAGWWTSSRSRSMPSAVTS